MTTVNSLTIKLCEMQLTFNFVLITPSYPSLTCIKQIVNYRASMYLWLTASPFDTSVFPILY